MWAAAAALFLASALGTAHADSFSTRPMQIDITSTPGSASDAITRLLGIDVTQGPRSANHGCQQGQSEFVRRALPDGYTLFFGGNTTMAANVFLVKNMTYDPLRNFRPKGGRHST
jgi:hypothetical protein